MFKAIRKFWEKYQKQVLFVKLSNLFASTSRSERRKRGYRWLRGKKENKKRVSRSQRNRLAKVKIQPPEFINFNPKKTRRYMHAWDKRMIEARRKKNGQS